MKTKTRGPRYAEDEGLLREIAMLVVTRRSKSARAAAKQIAPKARGNSFDAKFQRLYRAYLDRPFELEAEARNILTRQPKLMRKTGRPERWLSRYQNMTRSEFNKEIRRLLSMSVRPRNSHGR